MINKTLLKISLAIIAIVSLSTSLNVSAQYGGTITIGDKPQVATNIKPETIKIEEPYTCGKDIHGRVVSATLGKITVEVTNAERKYTFTPAFDANGNYSFVPTEFGVIPGLYNVVYYAATTSGLESDKFTYTADIKNLKDCVTGVNASGTIFTYNGENGTINRPTAGTLAVNALGNNFVRMVGSTYGDHAGRSVGYVTTAMNGLVRSGGNHRLL